MARQEMRQVGSACNPAMSQARVTQWLQAEPSFELPERLREYAGPPGDKKALVQWRQEQQVGTAWAVSGGTRRVRLLDVRWYG